jgi:hypothetical protein
MPVAVEAPRLVPRTRAELGLPEGFLVLFLLDFNSVLERKNPLGLIEAFARAFPAGSGASLAIKCVNGHLHPADEARLRLDARRHPDVHLIEGYVSAEERDAMIASCDVYASLHRSEGFGLTLAEAMALGRPVVATGWSGNLDFMDDDCAWLVPAQLVAVGLGNGPYDPASHWADPDLDAAAAALWAIRDDPAAAAEKAERGRQRIVRDHAPEVVGEAMRARLESLRRKLEATPREAVLPEAREALAAARERAAVDPRAYGGGGFKGKLRNRLLGLMAPVIENQRASDVFVLDAVERAAAEVAQAQRDQAALVAAQLAALRRADARIDALEADRASAGRRRER